MASFKTDGHFYLRPRFKFISKEIFKVKRTEFSLYTSLEDVKSTIALVQKILK